MKEKKHFVLCESFKILILKNNIINVMQVIDFSIFLLNILYMLKVLNNLIQI